MKTRAGLVKGGIFRLPAPLLCLLLCTLITACSKDRPEWQIEHFPEGAFTPRHEASLVAHKDKIYLMGGRRTNPVDRYDPAGNSWQKLSLPPLELHHFQAVSLGDAIYILGAMTGDWPNEVPADRVIKYYPDEDRFEFTHLIPESRRRGGAGAAVYNNKIYLLGGITEGHQGGYQPWLDEYDPITGEWNALPDAPNSRDHFQAVVLGEKLYAFAGRRTSHATGEALSLTTRYGNVFDFRTGEWLPVTQNLAIPTPRAGNMAIAWEDSIILAGGESGTQKTAHNEVEVFNTSTGSWHSWPSLNVGRHGSGLAILGNHLYTVSGSGNAGGEPELLSLERVELDSDLNIVIANTEKETAQDVSVHTLAGNHSLPVFMRWHSLTLPFEGPNTSENASENPFTDYRLSVTFTHSTSHYKVRGYYAADGRAADSGANSGNIWQVRFTPGQTGEWHYSAELRKGKDIALNDDPQDGEHIPLAQSQGSFIVTGSDKTGSDKTGSDFRANGRLIADKGYFRFLHSDKYWLKGGTNSPENLLGYIEFDNTYVAETSAREGEAARDGNIHRYAPHIDDWKIGDPTWGEGQNTGRGTGIIGAINYLGSVGMNAAYFLTFNLTGDGNDVWPYAGKDDFERFDVSKLDQWEVVFQHMQARGVLLHMVTQETENERLLDDGNTGRLRQLYYRELIARFGHHLGLVWNLGEENGPADFSPHAQDDQQRMDMANYISANDPYDHPIVIHTHSEAIDKEHILSPLLGLKSLDGASFQVDERTRVNNEIAEWRRRSKEAGNEWLITMDEIGKWHTGAQLDSEDPNHDTLRQHALWGAILAGAAGVEWYFGAHSTANDLSSEDWRLRDRLWHVTRIALDFFSDRPYWNYTPCNELIRSEYTGSIDSWKGYCGGLSGQEYVIYLPSNTQAIFDSSELDGIYNIQWFDPINGGEFTKGSIGSMESGKIQSLGELPDSTDQDWVILLSRQ